MSILCLPIKWASVSLLLLVTACMGSGDLGMYYYFSFEERPDLRVLAHGRLNIRGRFLHNFEVRPVRYELVDDAYTVYLDVDVFEQGPRILLWASNQEGAFYRIQGVFPLGIDPRERCGRFYYANERYMEQNLHWKEVVGIPRRARKNDPYWKSMKKALANEKVRVYTWHRVQEHCMTGDDHTVEVLSFQVFDEDDVLVGEETLSFDVIGYFAW